MSARQVITTRDDMDALPPRTVIAQFFPADQYGHPPGILVYVRTEEPHGHWGAGWQGMDDYGPYGSNILLADHLAEPRTFEVLYTPDETP